MDLKKINWKNFEMEFNELGYSVLPQLFDSDFISRCKKELESAIESDNAYHKTRNHKDYGMVLNCAIHGDSFLHVFKNSAFVNAFEVFLEDTCIVYSYTSSSMPPGATNYSNRVHVDCPRLISNYITNMGAVIALSDFSKENGATYVLPGSQWQASPPTEKEFYERAIQLECKAGDVIYLNSRLWHAGGMNTTADWRHAVTVGMCRGWMKQRLDFPRMLGDKEPLLPAKSLQKLGFYSQIPASYSEYYAPPELRKFKQRTS